jgi:hypothetical protein
VQNQLIQWCAELSGRTVAPHLRRDLGAATVEQCKLLLQAVQLGLADGILAPKQAQWLVSLLKGVPAEDTTSELPADALHAAAPTYCQQTHLYVVSQRFLSTLSATAYAVPASGQPMLRLGRPLASGRRTATQAAGADDAGGDAGTLAYLLPAGQQPTLQGLADDGCKLPITSTTLKSLPVCLHAPLCLQRSPRL